jgi:hypothetical protein
VGRTQQAEIVAERHAQEHADITGHPVQLTDVESWSAIRTVPGSGCLPLWD